MSPLAMTTTVLVLRAGVLDLRAGVPGAEPRAANVAFSILPSTDGLDCAPRTAQK